MERFDLFKKTKSSLSSMRMTAFTKGMWILFYDTFLWHFFDTFLHFMIHFYDIFPSFCHKNVYFYILWYIFITFSLHFLHFMTHFLWHFSFVFWHFFFTFLWHIFYDIFLHFLELKFRKYWKTPGHFIKPQNIEKNTMIKNSVKFRKCW